MRASNCVTISLRTLTQCIKWTDKIINDFSACSDGWILLWQSSAMKNYSDHSGYIYLEQWIEPLIPYRENNILFIMMSQNIVLTKSSTKAMIWRYILLWNYISHLSKSYFLFLIYHYTYSIRFGVFYVAYYISMG